ncbi:MAG: hypothetical protein K2X77_04660 [Candidatus Obscuribacterales bacterium]|nr:hypothetical protein [Candidatus Obscuribacterales bacterium]
MLNSTTFSTKSTCCNVSGTQSRRITREEMITLKSSVGVRRGNSGRRAMEVIGSYLQGLVTLITTPVKAERKNAMCHNYGHVIKSAKWEGYLPKCGDCGVEIKSPDMLRKATPVR